MTGRKLFPLTIVLVLFGLTACVAVRQRQHPAEGNIAGARPLCTACHDRGGEMANYASLDHTPLFLRDHAAAARLYPRVCVGCHADDSCARCHASRTGINPAERHPERVWSGQAPHRGEYLVRHRIDGRLDPTACFPCHGNPQSARRCASCHG